MNRFPRTHGAHLHVAQEAKRAGTLRADDHAFAAGGGTRFVTGGNLDFNVPIVQPTNWVRNRRGKGTAVFPALCVAAGLPRPHSEHQFHAVRRWQFDYAFPEPKIAVEVEGGIWTKGGAGHSHPLGIERDIEKYNAAAMLGWRVLRYAPENLGNAVHDLRIILAAA